MNLDKIMELLYQGKYTLRPMDDGNIGEMKVEFSDYISEPAPIDFNVENTEKKPALPGDLPPPHMGSAADLTSLAPYGNTKAAFEGLADRIFTELSAEIYSYMFGLNGLIPDLDPGNQIHIPDPLSERIEEKRTVVLGVLTDENTDDDTGGGIDEEEDPQNNPPIDPDEEVTYSEDEVQAGQTVMDFLLNGATDPDGDDLDVLSLNSGNITANINGVDVSGNFTISIVGFVVTVSYLGNDVLTFTFDPETGTKQTTSLDNAFWSALGVGDLVDAKIHYTITDNNGGTDDSTATIDIYGLNDVPVDPDEVANFTEDQIQNDPFLVNFKLNGAMDVDGDDVDVQSLDSASITTNIGGIFTWSISGFVVTIKHNGNDVLTMTVDPETGSEQITSKNDAFWSSLGKNDFVTIKVGYTVVDENGATDTSMQTINVCGRNDKPVDPDEVANFTEDQIQNDPFLVNFKLAGAIDPDGDDLDVQSLDSASITSNIGGTFTWSISGFVVTIKHNGNDVLTMTVDPETGSEQITSKNDAFWNGLGKNDFVSIRVGYTITDGNGGTDTSTQEINVCGRNDKPVDPDEVANFTEDQIQNDPFLPNFKLSGATDPDGDDIDVQSLDSATITTNMGGIFTWSISGFVVTIKHNGNDVLTMTVDPETGSEQITSKNDAFWNSMNKDDLVSIRVNYTVTDNNGGTDTSKQTINITGLEDKPDCGCHEDDCDVFPIYKPPFDSSDKYMANGLLGLAVVQHLTDYFTDPAHTNNSDYSHAQYFTGPSGVPVSVLGSANGDDIVFAVSGNNINGGNGNDFLMDKSSKQDLNLSGGADNDILIGGSKDSHLTGGACGDFIFGGKGNDEIVGGSGNDILVGGEGHDDMRGDSGKDTLYGGTGNDELSGGSGQDAFLYDLGGNFNNGGDLITDFDLAKNNNPGDILFFDNVMEKNGISGITVADLDANTNFKVLEGNYNNGSGAFNTSSNGSDIKVDLGSHGFIIIEGIGSSVPGSGSIHTFAQLVDAGVNIVVSA
ncbi:MAG: hypothetical protein KBB83_03860 [Alphaproteobacteria bacterium]|nr:hypothetical protein [Alphaproteobacteria bacterium]